MLFLVVGGCSQGLNLFILLLRLLHLLLGLLVLLAEDGFFEGSRLHVVVIEVDRLSMQEAVRVLLCLLNQSLSAFAAPNGALCVRRWRILRWVQLAKNFVAACSGSTICLLQSILVKCIVGHSDVDRPLRRLQILPTFPMHTFAV